MVLSEYGHLLPAYRRHAGLPDEERIAWIRADRWLDFEQAHGALARLEDLLRLPTARSHALPAHLRRHGHGQNEDHS